eukprot:GSMAST32.ASY1.ANO1.1469.1 assembled CDS
MLQINKMPEKLKKLFNARCLRSDISSKEYEQTKLDVLNGTCRLLYVTVQSFVCQCILQKLYDRGKLSRVVVDEAHCISTWGEDLSPNYKDLHKWLRMFPSISLLALTATATIFVQKTIANDLFGSDDFNTYTMIRENIGGRQNLFFACEELSEWNSRNQGHPGIVYTITKKECESLCRHINLKFGEGIATYYHGGIRTSRDKTYLHKKWSEGCSNPGKWPIIMCATEAFGMGVNNQNVRWVLHAALPKSLLHLYQQAGRAGRDRKPAQCLVLFHRDQQNLLRSITTGFSNKITEIVKQRRRIEIEKCHAYCCDKITCRQVAFRRYFNGENGNTYERCNNCDNCLRYKDHQKSLEFRSESNTTDGDENYDDFCSESNTTDGDDIDENYDDYSSANSKISGEYADEYEYTECTNEKIVFENLPQNGEFVFVKGHKKGLFDVSFGVYVLFFFEFRIYFFSFFLKYFFTIHVCRR